MNFIIFIQGKNHDYIVINIIINVSFMMVVNKHLRIKVSANAEHAITFDYAKVIISK